MHVMLMENILNRNVKIAVIGLGYVGMPLAVALANSGFDVLGIDTAEEKINILKSGKSYIIDITDPAIEKIINRKLFVGSDFSVISEAGVIIICMPTPLKKTGEPDVSYIEAAVDKVAEYMKEGSLVILESTTYPGSTEELVVNVLESRRNFEVGKDCFVCYSPERIDPGNRYFSVRNTPKVIGGITEKCLEAGRAVYGTIIDEIIPVSSTRTAEMVKLLENTFRSVNIALVNELAQMCGRMGINIWEVIDAASTKPFGFMPFYPGPGTGGHCIPLDPIYLSWRGKAFNFNNRFIELASDINNNMPQYVVSRITDILNGKNKPVGDSGIFLIGMSYKKDVGDLRESPALKIFLLLKEKRARVIYHDPYIPCFTESGEVFHSQKLDEENLRNSDLVVITTDHSNIDYQFVVNNSRLVFDTRNAAKNCTGGNIILLGVEKKEGNIK